MATNNLNMIIVVISTILALAVSVAAQGTGLTVTVGGSEGWRYGFDHQDYIKNYDLIVGDQLRMCLQSYAYKFSSDCFFIYILIWNDFILARN